MKVNPGDLHGLVIEAQIYCGTYRVNCTVGDRGLNLQWEKVAANLPIPNMPPHIPFSEMAEWEWDYHEPFHRLRPDLGTVIFHRESVRCVASAHTFETWTKIQNERVMSLDPHRVSHLTRTLDDSNPEPGLKYNRTYLPSTYHGFDGKGRVFAFKCTLTRKEAFGSSAKFNWGSEDDDSSEYYTHTQLQQIQWEQVDEHTFVCVDFAGGTLIAHLKADSEMYTGGVLF